MEPFVAIITPIGNYPYKLATQNASPGDCKVHIPGTMANSQSPTAKLDMPPPESTVKLSLVAREIVSALNAQPLNHSQKAVLEFHLKNFRADGPHVDIQTVAEHLSREGIVNEDRAKDFVNGAMRSFGKRLNQLLTNIPNRTGLDRSREGVADPVPLLALFSIAKDKHGATRHRLTENGAMAVSLVLGADSSGISSFNGIGDPTEVIGFGMERLSAALIDRVAQSLGVGRDEAIKTMTAKMGAG